MMSILGRRRLALSVIVSAAALLLLPTPAVPAPAAPADPGLVPFVSHRTPLVGPARQLGAIRSRRLAGHPTAPTRPAADANPWRLQATIPGAIIHDIAFPSPKVGYAAAELGQVWKTADGGMTWTEVMNLGFPFYWYGVNAFTANDVVVSGFDNSNFTGILSWSHDGGATWSPNVVITTDGWSNRVRFVGTERGLVGSIVSLNNANEAQYTTDGGGTSGDWTTVVPDPDGGWFGADFAFLPDLAAYLSGITNCVSPNGGMTWTCRPSVDSVFDGAVEFVNHRDGWVAGGEISPNVEGWVHVTTDGGATWSGRTLDAPWPIRDLHFLTSRMGWAAGGNVFSGVGGMYFSSDGGQTWSLDADTGAEISSCVHLRRGTKVQIWCAGTTSSFAGVIYSLRMGP